jgi:TRAP-type C4-dicarboxylate transport system permease small subunit
MRLIANLGDSLKTIVSLLIKVETGVLVLLVLAMIFMAVLQIFLRNVFDTGIVYSESLVRVLVLWVTLIGAMTAARRDKHIRLEVLMHYLPQRRQSIAKIATELFTAAICFIVGYFGFRFVVLEYQDGGIAFAGVPHWVCESIIPFSFFVLGSRYLFSSAMQVKIAMKKNA